MAAKVPIVNFSKGEIAPELFARIDVEQYNAGAKKVRNFIIQPYGGLASRPGFRVIGEVDDAAAEGRLIPFQASSLTADAAYVVAAQDGSARLLSGGGFVLEEGLKITDITKAVNAKITAPYHGYAVGARIFLNGIEGMTELNERFAKVVSVIDDSNFTININTVGYSTFTGSDGTLRTAPPPTPPTPTPPDPPVVPDPPPTTGGSGGSGANNRNPHEQLP